jgi:hypothetical protein
MSDAIRTLYLGSIVPNICQSNSHANAVIRFARLYVQGDNTPVTIHVQSADDTRQPTLLNTFGQVRAPVRSFQTAIKEELNAEQHFVTF